MKDLYNSLSLRQQKIMDYLNEHKEAKTEELSELFNTSSITIRRDLKDLEAAGLVLRYYGGVRTLKPETITDNELLEIKKQAIAKYAASLVEDGDTIFINSSSTAISILDYLGNKRVTVVTNNGKSLQKDLDSNIYLVLTGGEVYGRKQSMVGDLAMQVLSNITATKCFVGVSGIQHDSGISTSVLQETTINKEMINRCTGPVYVVTTSSKLGIHHNFSSGNISDVDYLITDLDADSKEINALNKAGVQSILIDYNEDTI
ncbi:DeoR/GlpR family DNA-binding transcription regulator [Clostridium carnis]